VLVLLVTVAWYRSRYPGVGPGVVTGSDGSGWVVELEYSGSRYDAGGSGLGCGPRVGSRFVLVPGVLEVSAVLVLHL